MTKEQEWRPPAYAAATGRTTISERHCERCGHNWYPRKPTPPISCPSCRSPYWYRERRRKGSA